ncbi:MAG: hypothetical protein ABS895_04340 [Aerococcus urinaeequi]
MSKINMNHFNKAYIAVVLAFILAIGAYDISYSKTNAETETTTNQPTDTKTTEESALLPLQMMRKELKQVKLSWQKPSPHRLRQTPQPMKKPVTWPNFQPTMQMTSKLIL